MVAAGRITGTVTRGQLTFSLSLSLSSVVSLLWLRCQGSRKEGGQKFRGWGKKGRKREKLVALSREKLIVVVIKSIGAPRCWSQRSKMVNAAMTHKNCET